MTPVAQTILKPPTGNCFAACVASILELPVATVPNMYEGADTLLYDRDKAYDRVQRWLRGMGLRLLSFDRDDAEEAHIDWGRTWRPSGYWIATHEPVGGTPHATVWKGDRFVWNPFPGASQVVGELVMMEWFELLDPALLARSLPGRWRRAAR